MLCVFLYSAEKRETGFVATVKDTYGFVDCTDRKAQIFFRLSEVNSHQTPAPGDEVCVCVRVCICVCCVLR